MQHKPKTRAVERLQVPQRRERARYGAGGAVPGRPISEEAVAEEFVDGAVVVFDDLFAGGQPTASEAGNLVGGQTLEEVGGVFQVGHQQPAVHGADFRNGLGGGLIALPLGRALVEAESVGVVGDFDDVLVIQPAGLAHAPAIQIGAVAAAQIDQPELALPLGVDHRVTARDFVVGQDHVVGRRSAEGTGAADGRLRAEGRFQPGHGS